MGRPKGAKNKSKQLEQEKIVHYCGHFLMDSGLKIEFDVPTDEVDEKEFEEMVNNARFPDNGNVLYLGNSADTPFLRRQKIVGYEIDSYESIE